MNDRNVGEHRLTLAEVLDWMVEDKLVDRDTAFADFFHSKAACFVKARAP